MNITLNRSGGVPLRDQLVAQLELQILAGKLAPGSRLPSVRELATELQLHANTISAAYRQLQHTGHATLRAGAGVFVKGRGGPNLESAGDLDAMIRVALATAFRKGFSTEQVKAAVQRWLGARPPERVVVTDPSLEMAELLAHELRHEVQLPVEPMALERLARTPDVLDGALAVGLPYHVDRLRQLRPGAAIEALQLDIPAADREVVQRLPSGAIVLVVSHSPTVLPFAAKLIFSLRGDDLIVQTHLLESRGWRRLVSVADLVLADSLATPRLADLGAKRLRELRLLPALSLRAVRRTLAAALTPRR